MLSPSLNYGHLRSASHARPTIMYASGAEQFGFIVNMNPLGGTVPHLWKIPRAAYERAMPRKNDVAHLILFNKPYGVLSQFTDRGTETARSTLSDFIDMPGVYPAGRLDRDSEGLLLLTDDGRLQARIADPKFKLPKTYLVQIEGEPDDTALARLRAGVMLKDGPTRPAEIERIDDPGLWPRDPPIRYRANIPDAWLRITIREGRNRQVRRMTAAVGHPTLRLVRWSIGDWTVADIAPGTWRAA
jgi:23S rRNA pseudouridine2457 synthase